MAEWLPEVLSVKPKVAPQPLLDRHFA